MAQLGKAFGIVMRAIATEHIMHADVSLWGAPFECHRAVEKGEAIRMRRARRHAKSVSGLNRRMFNKAMRDVPSYVWGRALERVIAKHWPFGDDR